MKFKNVIRGIFIGATLAVILELTGFLNNVAYKIKDCYHNQKSVAAAEEGSAYFNIFDKDGLDSIVISNNTSEDSELTQIPEIKASNFYAYNCPVNLKNLRRGKYIFKVEIRDDLGNLEEKTYELDIKNKNEGVKTLYGAKLFIENERLPEGKEEFDLN